MTEPDTMTDVYRRLALALEPDLVETPIVWSPLVEAGVHAADLHRFRVSNERGLDVSSVSSLGAWTAALEACQRRAAWRAMKAKRKLERPGVRTVDCSPGLYLDDDVPDGAA